MARTTKAKATAPTLELTATELAHVQHAVEHEQDQHQLSMGRLNPALETAAEKLRAFGEAMAEFAKQVDEAAEAVGDGDADA